MKFLKSKILFYIIFVVMLYCLYEWSKNDGIKVTLQAVKTGFIDPGYVGFEDDPGYIQFVNEYNDSMKQLDKNKKYDLVVGIICLTFIIYYLMKRL